MAEFERNDKKTVRAGDLFDFIYICANAFLSRVPLDVFTCSYSDGSAAGPCDANCPCPPNKKCTAAPFPCPDETVRSMRDVIYNGRIIMALVTLLTPEGKYRGHYSRRLNTDLCRLLSALNAHREAVAKSGKRSFSAMTTFVDLAVAACRARLDLYYISLTSGSDMSDPDVYSSGMFITNGFSRKMLCASRMEINNVCRYVFDRIDCCYGVEQSGEFATDEETVSQEQLIAMMAMRFSALISDNKLCTLKNIKSHLSGVISLIDTLIFFLAAVRKNYPKKELEKYLPVFMKKVCEDSAFSSINNVN